MSKIKKPVLVFLIGMPASGKTYWGEKLAHELNWPFIDLDAYIEQQEGNTIAELFNVHGEAAFRKMEQQSLKKIIHSAIRPGIVACGGGTPIFHNNLELMKQEGVVIYLKAEIPYLMSNLGKKAADRPLLSGNKDLSSQLTDLFLKRSEFYEQAHHICEVKDISVFTFVEILSVCTDWP